MKIRVAFSSSSNAYTYNWPEWMPGPAPDIGDVVEIPPNWAFPEGGRTGVVVAVGSDYTGPLSDIVRVVPFEEQVNE
jgi:hypothetical protein